MSEQVPIISTITTDDGWSVTSQGTPDEIRAHLAVTDAKPDGSESDALPTESVDAAADEHPAAGSTGGEDTAATNVPPKKLDKRTRDGKKQSIQDEINTLTAQKSQTERDIADTANRLAELQSALARAERDRAASAAPALPPQRHGSVPAPADDPEPTFDQFLNEADSVTAYNKAVARWAGRQEAQKHFQALQAQTDARLAETAFKARQEACASKVLAASQADPTYAGKIDARLWGLRSIVQLQAGEVPTGATAIADAILDSDNPDRLLLALSEQRSEFDRIAALHPMLASREMGRFESRLTAASHGPASSPIVASAAPPPTKPLGGAPRMPPPSDDDDDTDVDFDTHMKRAIDKEQKARRRNGRV